MSRKTKNTPSSNNEITDTLDASTIDKATDLPAQSSEVITTDDSNNKIAAKDKPLVHNPFTKIVLSGKGKKLSPKSTDAIFFEIAIHDEDKCHYLRLSGNEGGGLHSKEWIKLATLIAILDEQVDKPFKSAALKSAFKSANQNNHSFLTGALRSDDIGLITQSGKSVFLHVLATDFDEKKAKLLALT